MTINSGFIEKIMMKGMMEDKQFLILISQVFEKEYFDNATIGEVFEVSKKYVETYNKIPSKDVILNSIEDTKDVKSLFEEANNMTFDVVKDYDFLLENTNNHLKDQAMKRAIVDSVDIIDKNGNKGEIRSKIESALCKDIKVDLGTKYFGDLSERLRKIFTLTETKVPTGYNLFDEMISGGFPPLSLSIIASKVHGMKSTTLANFAIRQALKGLNVVLITLEMSEMAFSQRLDSILSLMDINRMYSGKENKVKLVKSLKDIKENQSNNGDVFIKEFPTGASSVDDFRVYLRELTIRGVKPDILYVDYVNLMRSAYKTDGSLYSSVKKIVEELRALSFEFGIPVVSVTQLNREGMFTGFKELDFRYIAECLDLDTLVDKLNKNVFIKEKLRNIKKDDIIKNNNGLVKVKRVFDIKKKKMYKVKTKSGKELICSEDHKFPTNVGELSIKIGLSIGHKLNTK